MSSVAVLADDDLQRRVTTYLWQKQLPALRAVQVWAENGQVVLQGKLNSFYEKQLCLHSCQRVAGVVRIVDELEVSHSRAGAAV